MRQPSRSFEKFLTEQKVGYTKTYIDSGRLMIRFPNVVEQLQARDAVNDHFGDQYLTALSFASRAPELLRQLGLRPMPLGLDLRGGLYLLYQVDVNGAVNQLLEGYEQDIRRALAQANLQFTDVVPVSVDSARPNGVQVLLPAGADAEAVRKALAKPLADLKLESVTLASGPAVQAIDDAGANTSAPGLRDSAESDHPAQSRE
jgi:preprotein translocase subunit SecD